MRLTDLMSGAGLSRYAEIALIIFFVAFLVIVGRLLLPGQRRQAEEHKQLPFRDEQPPRDET